MAVNKRPTFGVIFLKGHISLKNGTYCPLFSHNFLLSWNKQRLLCMGRTSSAISPLILIYWNKQFEYSRLSRQEVQSFNSINSENIWYCIRMIVTCTHRVVVIPDWCVETALGLSLLPVKARFILSLSLYWNDLSKIFIYFYFFIPRVFY
jgi:hypothetical protein